MHPKYFKPELNTKYTLSLRYPAPKTVNGFSGPELRWILSDGQAFYTPLDFADKLKALGISKPGQKFQAEKRPNGRKAEWFVTHLPDLQKPQAAVALAERAGALDAPDAELERNPQTQKTGSSTALEAALKTAVTAAAAAERHGQGMGYNVRFAPQDIRAMAISVLIQNGRAA